MKLLCCVALILISMTQAVLAEEDQNIVLNVSPHIEDCNAKIARQVELAVLLRDFDNYHNVCVTTEGFYSGRTLFMSRQDAKIKHATTSHNTDGRRIGVYGKAVEGLSNSLKLRYVRITGKIWTCDDLRDSNTIMLMGYCHYTGGPIIGTTAFEDARRTK